MYSKDELSAKNVVELKDIAKGLGAKIKSGDNKETIIYTILDAQAEMPTTGGIKRKRVRITSKKEDRVYSVKGKDGENFDVMKNQVNGPVPTISEAPLFKDSEEKTTVEPVAEGYKPEEIVDETKKAKTAENNVAPANVDPLAAFPKHRGRKSKAELEAIAAAKAAAIKQQQEAMRAAQEAEEPQNDMKQETNPASEETVQAQEEFIPEAQFTTSNNSTQDNSELMAQLQAKMNAHYSSNAASENEASENPVNEASAQTFDHAPAVGSIGVWEGDPGDGTDFIPVIDLPIEDQAAMPTYDIFDRPMAPSRNEVPAPAVTPTIQSTESAYDFSDIITSNGVLEAMPDGYGFLRSSDYNYLSSPDDVYVPSNIIKRYGLKTGDVIQCHVRPPHEGEKYFPITTIDKINGRNPAEVRDRIPFEHLTPLFPNEKFSLCGDRATTNLSTRIVDLFSPIGKGQRALIVAQPKTGKTILMKDIANAIAANHPEAYLMMLLIDERPEEVTDMARTVNAEVIASTFDEPAERHVKIAGIVLEKAKRMVECGHDVVIFLDSITRLARAYNTVAPASGKVLTGGVDANALQKPKRFFGAARNIEGGGSLTIIATALIDTGSKMDEVIFEEFKGTGNMELQLDRSLSNKRIFPAVNLVASSTRRDDLLQDKTTLDRMWILRKYISDMNSIEAMNTIHNSMERTRNNEEFLLSMNS